MVTFHLDRETPVPLHFQLRTQIKEAIQSGALRSGDILPSEPQLATLAGVSRATVRQGIEELVREGLLRRQRGHGTFVADPPAPTVIRSTGEVEGAAASVVRGALDTPPRVVRVAQATPPADVAEALGVDRSEHVTEVVRLWSVNGEPALMETVYVPGMQVSEVMHAGADDRALYSAIEKHYNRAVTRADAALRAEVFNQEIADTLKVQPGSIGFFLERRTYVGDVLAELRQAYIAGDRYDFQLSLSRAQLMAG